MVQCLGFACRDLGRGGMRAARGEALWCHHPLGVWNGAKLGSLTTMMVASIGERALGIEVRVCISFEIDETLRGSARPRDAGQRSWYCRRVYAMAKVRRSISGIESTSHM